MNNYRSLDGHANLPLIHSLPVSVADALSARDALFASLDGQIIRGRSGAWRAEVVSIVAERDVTWVQIGPAEDPSLSVVLRLNDGQRPDEALAALKSWSDLPEDRRPARIEVGLQS
ncbi:MAG: hypothetical protein ABMA15_05295 [Vicinamibacterales bacterium]